MAVTPYIWALWQTKTGKVIKINTKGLSLGVMKTVDSDLKLANLIKEYNE